MNENISTQIAGIIVQSFFIIIAEIIWLKLRTPTLVRLGDEVRVFVGYLCNTGLWETYPTLFQLLNKYLTSS